MKSSYVLAAVAAVLITIAYFALRSSGWVLVAVSDGIFAFGSGVCSVLAFLVCRRWGFRGRIGIVDSGLFLGVFLWFLSDVAFAVDEAVLHITLSFPSFGNGLLLAGYVPIALGVAQFLWAFKDGFRRIWTLTALGIGMLTLGVVCVLLVGPLIASAVNPFAAVFYLIYPVLDLVLFEFALLMVFAFAGGRLTRPWVWISVGLILRVLGDVALGVGELQGWYYSGHPIELIQLWAYFSFALGLGDQRQALFP